MSLMHRLTNLIGRRDLNPEIDEELQFHIDSRIRDNMAAGMSRDEARRDALMRFGGRARVREETRDTHVLVALESVAQDVRFALRSLVQRPLFTLLALATLALGIGANTAVFTIVRSVLLRPLPFPEGDRLYVITNAPIGRPYWLYPGMADSEYIAFREGDRTFEATATFGIAPATLTGAGGAVRVSRTVVTPDFFRVLRASPSMGRAFVAGDDHAGNDRVAVVSEALWRSRFGGDPGLVDRYITLDGVQHRVLGIAPAGFRYPGRTQLWTPLAVTVNPGRSFSRPVVGRLRDGVTADQARSVFSAAFTGGRVIPLRDAVVGDTRRALLVFSGAVAFVLLIACANVGNLLLMRAVSRRQEIATRLALGAGRARVVRQLVTESVVLSIGGGLAGIALAVASVPALLTLMPPGRLPTDIAIRLDVVVLLATLGVSILTGVLLGVVPALQATREDLSATLREGPRSLTKSSHRFRNCLVVAEVALALILLAGAGLLVRSFLNLRAVDTGFDASNVMTMTVDLPQGRYGNLDALNRFHQQLVASLQAIPGATAAGAINWMPLGNMLLRGDITVEDRRELPQDYIVTKAAVSADYFKTMGIRLIGGRLFTPDDDARAPAVVILSESVAKQIWPGEDPIGQRLSIESRPTARDWLTVVGIVGDVRQNGVKGRFVSAIYQPHLQVTRQGFLNHMTFAVRTQGEPERIGSMMRDALGAVDKDQAPQSLVSMETVLADTIAEPRFQSRLLGVFSVLAVLLAAIGIYGVLAASVAERSREIGIRLALGAGKASVIGMVLRRTLLLTVTGVVLGLSGAFATTTVLTGLLFNVTPTDATILTLAAAALVAVALIAGVLPARKAATVDPLIALRAL